MPPAARYSHLAVLGRGGMADVYLARSRGGELVALKRLRDASQLTEEYRVQLKREADISALLQHPNVVRFKDSGEDATGPYLALEYVEGVSAGALLRGVEAAGGPLELDGAYSLTADVAAGVAYAHGLDTASGRGVVHRDLSPGNVLVNLDGVARVADFGIARLADHTRLTSTGAVRGKLAYMAPELFHGDAASFASDCFALGCMAFELFTGVKPFRGVTDAELMNALLNGEPARLSALRPRVDPKVADWVQRSMAREPSARPTAEQLHSLATAALQGRKAEGERALAAWVKRLAPPVASQSAPEVAPPKPPSRRLVIIAAAACVALVSAGAAARWLRTSEPAAEPVAAVAPAPIAAPPEPEPQPQPEVAPEPAEPEPAAEPLAPPVARRRSAKVKAAPKALPKEGRLKVEVSPPAVVFVDGRRVGEAPLAPFSLPPGEHVVLVVNRAQGLSQSRSVGVRAGETTTVPMSLGPR